MQPYEKLGAFYLGRRFDAERSAITDETVLYDSADLTTHAVCLGMTGSGKTGLCIGMLEEAAIDGIPTLVIDPKGDLGNLMLTFPRLEPSDFAPWIDAEEAAREGQSVEQRATVIAQRWRKGLAEWDQSGERIARFRDAADVAIYTPGASAGIPLNVLGSFAAPPPTLRDDAEALRERVSVSVSGLLALLGIDADPVRSREHILLSNILLRAWEGGAGMDLGGLIRAIQSPGFDRIGVMDLESVFPSKDRFGLAMSLNNLLASPGFAGWMEGESLSIPKLLWTPSGKPRISILSIAHLPDEERMFFVTLLLGELKAWMRSQPGTASLRALLYMDEVFGYFPPTANPPSKKPMLTLLKQARAHGLGVMLATQNPVDLDYKGLSNAGTWLLGRLQTERDLARVLDGLEGASTASGAGFDRQAMERTLAGLKSRVFLMHNVHESEPVLFHTRWALSYLRGPLTREQISRLTVERQGEAAAAPGVPAKPAPAAKGRKAAEPAPAPAARPAAAAAAPAGASPPEPTPAAESRPILPAEVTELFRPVSLGVTDSASLIYRPSVLGSADLHFAQARSNVDVWEKAVVEAPLNDETVRSLWVASEPLEEGEPDLERSGAAGASYGSLPAVSTRAKTYASWGRSLKGHLYRDRVMTIWKCKALTATSEVGETEAEFRARLTHLAREKRDLQLKKLEKRYAPKVARIQDRIRRAEARVAREKSQYSQQKLQTAISMGSTVLGALFGRKAASVGTVGRAGTTLRGAGRVAREKGDIARARAEVEVQMQKLQALEEEFQDAVAEVRESSIAPDSLELQEVRIRPRKTDIAVDRVALVWSPWKTGADGFSEPAHKKSQ